MPAPLKWKSDFDVLSGFGGNNISQPWVNVSPDGRFGIIFTYQYASDTDTYMEYYFSDGAVAPLYGGSTNTLTGNGTDFAGLAPRDERMASAAYLGGSLRFVMVWTEDSVAGSGINQDVYFRIFGPNGIPTITTTLVRNGAGDQVDPVVASTSNGDFAIAFIDTNLPGNPVVLRTYDTLGVLLTEVSTTGSGPGTIANSGGDIRNLAITSLANGNYVLTWDYIGPGGLGPEVHGRVYTPLGVPAGNEFIVADVAGVVGGSGSDVVALANGGFMVVKIAGGGFVTGQFFLASGVASGAAFPIGANANLSTSDRADAALLNDGRIVVVWQSSANNGDIVGQLLSANGTPDGAVFTVNANTTGSQKHPSVNVLEDGRFVVAWEDQAASVPRATVTIFDPREAAMITSASSLGDDWHGTVFNDVLDMGAGNDTVHGGDGQDRLNGGTGDDIFRATGAMDGVDAMDGGADSDTVDYSALGATNAISVTLNGNNFAVVTIASGNNDNVLRIENVIGSAGADNIAGDFSINKLVGGLGDDTLQGGAGNDTLDGGPGNDTASYAGSLGAVTVTLSNLSGGHTGGTSSGPDGSDTIIDIENIIGSAFDDFLNGNNGANILVGGAGSDTTSYANLGAANGINVTLNGATNAVLTIVGGVSDTLREIENITGGNGADTIIGDSQDNALIGGFGNDYLGGQGGKDVFTFFHPADGADTIDGGTDIDTVIYTNLYSGNHITVTLNGATSSIVTISGQPDDLISNIENFISGSGSDKITGDGLTNVLNGGAGDDTLKGGLGDDTLDGSVGFDAAVFSGLRAAYTLVNVNATTWTVTGADGSDTVKNVEFLKFSDQIIALDAAGLNLFGTPAPDILIGGAFGDNIFGRASNDTLDGGGGWNALAGETGDDTYHAKGAYDVVTELAGEGTDTVYAYSNFNLPTFSEVESIIVQSVNGLYVTGNDTSQTILGNVGADTLYGGAGDDSLHGGSGSNVLWGGSGNDSFFATSATNFILEFIGEGYDTVYTTANMSLAVPTEIEAIVLQGAIGLLIGGSDTAQTITGSIGNDTISGAGDNDTIDGGAGADNLDGGAGVDTADYSASVSSVAVEMWTADATTGVLFATDGAGSFDQLSGFEALVGGSAGDLLSGDNGANTLTGNAGNDTLNGGFGDDSIDGGADDDYLFGAVGADTVLGGIGNDTIFGGDAGFSGGDLADSLIGSDGNDFIIGELGNDTLDGGLDSDFLVGGYFGTLVSGNDSLTGSDGFDTLLGEDGNDTLDGGNQDDFIIGGTGNDSIRGGDGVDFIVADGFGTESGDDTIDGGLGNDVIIGGLGSDRYTGGGGNDQFWLTLTAGQSSGTKTITDYDLVNDFVVIDAVNPGALTFAAIQGLMTQTGANVTINFATLGHPTTSLVIENTLIAQLQANDFIVF